MVLAAALGISSFLAGGATAAGFFENKLAAMQKELKDAQEEEKEQLHWDKKQVRGLGDLLRRVNHLAIIVEDVGRSLAWYSDIIGFQQIQRPNFDRHGAWLSMGNIELHLIKGKPHTKRGQHPDDLIVCHLALEVTDASAVLRRLEQMQQEVKFEEVWWRQNVSVPTFETSRTAKFESHTDGEGKVTQFFLEDPDGYWIEICNCSVLDAAVGYPAGAKVGGMVRAALMRWVQRARQHCREPFRFPHPATAIALHQVDGQKLQNLACRRATYGDICQGFGVEQLRHALAHAGNEVPTAVRLLQQVRAREGSWVLLPPKFLDNSKQLHLTQPIYMEHRPILLGNTGNTGNSANRQNSPPNRPTSV
ncbi:unnamed protein product [Effrenium voratum]|nr:unnamed protein product [Effrenium voratum]